MLVRRVDAEATALQRQGELGIWASLLGQEAAQVGSGRAMREDDYAFPTYREHGVAWCRGVDPLNLLGLFRGVNHGGWDPNEKNFHLYTIVIGAQTLHATGYAMGMQKDGAESAVIAYFGDGATSQGDVNEAFIYASVFNAPVVFFCQNNQWAISEPIEKQTPHPALPAGDAASASPASGSTATTCSPCSPSPRPRCRTPARATGPTLVEAYTYRMGAHTTSDDPTRYRLTDELESWKLKDPIERVKAYLVAQRHRRPGVLRRARGRVRRARRARAQGLPRDARPRAAVDLRPRLRRAAPAARGGARAVRAPTSTRSRGATH